MAADSSEWAGPNYTEVYQRRARILDGLRETEAWPEAGIYYAENVADWIEDFIWTYDPRLVNYGRSPFVPFILFPKQRQLLAWIEDRYAGRESGIVEKSRDVGISWVCLAFALHQWIFTPGIKISFGSRVVDLVDTMDDPDSLLQRIRIMLEWLPTEMQPLGYTADKHARYMKLTNPENDSVITGEGGKNIGRGGRSSLYFLDEAAFVENPEAVEAALSQNTDVRIDVSTPNGTGNPFYRKRMGGHIKVFTYHWRDDPRKTQAWYEEQKLALEPEVLAQEVDLDYEASAGDVVVSAKWVEASKTLRKRLESEGKLPTRKDGIGGLDVGAGTAKSVFIPRWSSLVGASDSWTDQDTTNTAKRALGLSQSTDCKRLKFDSIGVGQGVASTLRRLTGRGVRTHGVNVGEKPSVTMWPDGKSARKKFTNLRAELWWVVRDRLRKTYQHLEFLEGGGGQEQNLDDLLLLPDDSHLCSELSIPRYFRTEAGKIQIESKRQMKSRGVPSPDFADALVLTFAPAPPRVVSGRTRGMV